MHRNTCVVAWHIGTCALACVTSTFLALRASGETETPLPLSSHRYRKSNPTSRPTTEKPASSGALGKHLAAPLFARENPMSSYFLAFPRRSPPCCIETSLSIMCLCPPVQTAKLPATKRSLAACQKSGPSLGLHCADESVQTTVACFAHRLRRNAEQVDRRATMDDQKSRGTRTTAQPDQGEHECCRSISFELSQLPRSSWQGRLKHLPFSVALPYCSPAQVTTTCRWSLMAGRFSD